MNGQFTLFDFTKPLFKIDKPIRLIELFAGIGCQAMAFEEMNIGTELFGAVEIDKYAIASYNAIHRTDCQTQDIKELRGGDLNITDRDKYTYILTYSFP